MYKRGDVVELAVRHRLTPVRWRASPLHPPSAPDWLAHSGVRNVRASGAASVARLEPAGRWFDVSVVRWATKAHVCFPQMYVYVYYM